MGKATNHHTHMATAQQANKAGLPQFLTNQPPSQPPTKKPNDCKVL
jgi:hypothetical protein